MAKKNESTALAVAPEQNAAALASVLEGLEFDVDGLEGADESDIRTPTIIFNMKGPDDSGRLRQLNEFIFMDSGEFTTELHVVFVAFTKSNAFKVFDQAANKNVTICSSPDQVTGKMRRSHPSLPLAEGTERKCETCVDMEWSTDEKGKKKRNCAEVANVLGATLTPDLQLDREFMMRFSKTSYRPFMDYLNKFHFKKHPTKRGANLPLFVFEAVLKLVVDKSGNFAVPSFERGRPLSRETIATLAQVSKDFIEAREAYVAKMDRDEEKHAGSEAIDTTGTSSGGFRPDDFADN